MELFDQMISNKLVESEVHPISNASPNNVLAPVNHRMKGYESRPSISSIPRIVPVFPDNGRMNGINNCPIILLLGGPGSGRTEQALSLCKKFPGLAYFNVTDFLRKNVLDFINENDTKDWDDVQSEVIRLESSNLAENNRAVIIEGFPCHEGQLNTFNQCIGGVDLVILLDCEETTLIDRLHQRYERLKRAEDEDAIVLQRISFFKHCTLPVIRYYDERGKLVTKDNPRHELPPYRKLLCGLEWCSRKNSYRVIMGNNLCILFHILSFKKKKEKSNNETSDNKIVKTEEIIPVISKLLKNENRKLLTSVTIDDDQSLETSFEDSVTKDNDSSPSSQIIITPECKQNSLDQIELKLDNLEGSCDEIRRLYCKHILKQCNYNYISMKSITDPMNFDGDNTFNLDKLIQIIIEEMSRTRKAGYIIDGIPNNLAQAKEIEAYSDSLKFSNCKLVVLLEDKFSEHDHSGDNLQCHKNKVEESLIEFLESTKKLYRVS
ncbi:unnamed protein product [Schistosoma mattheei]|uniref:Adenylate kinase isoenzyme 5 n=1 Tax=Schistosoma mattheei TaxID=31246 RepID=A0A3P8ECA6_9TREM|nr:unnamed protein product [Schistosoma mattheei]